MLISRQEYKEEMIPCITPILNREDYYKKYMDKGIDIDNAYDKLIQFDTFTGIPFDETFAWMHHYSYEFNESPYPQVNRCIKLLQKTSRSYEWQ